jgi:hypothetical protein
MLLPNVFRYTQSLVEESIRSSWVAANGLFGAVLAGAAMIWRGVLPLVSTDLTSVWNWVLSFAIYAVGSWAVLFVASFILIAPYRSWQKVTLAAAAERGRVDALKAQIEQSNNRKSKRVGLADLLNDGEVLMSRCMDQSSSPQIDADSWAGKAETFLKSYLDDSYVKRFRNGANIMQSIPNGMPFTSPNYNLWSGLRIRVIRLDEFIKELSS